MSEFEQPPKLDGDGDVSVQRIDAYFLLKCGDESMLVSGYNACRLFGCIALMLGIPLGRKIGKAIKL